MNVVIKGRVPRLGACARYDLSLFNPIVFKTTGNEEILLAGLLSFEISWSVKT